MNKLKIAIKALEVAVNIIILVTSGREIANELKKHYGKRKTNTPKADEV